MESLVTQQLEEGITNMRINLGASTKLATRIRPLITNLLECREKLEILDLNDFNGWDHKTKSWDTLIFTKHGVKRQRAYNKALKNLVDSKPSNYKYRIKLSTLNSADPLAIRKIALDGATDEELSIYLHGTSYDKNKRKGLNMTAKHDSGNRQIFAIGVKMFALFNGVIKTRIGVMVVWPPRAARKGRGRSNQTKKETKEEATKEVDSDFEDSYSDEEEDGDDDF